MSEIAVGDSLTKVADATLSGFEQVAIDLLNKGSAAFSGCELKLKATKTSPGVTWQSGSEEWISPKSTSNIVRLSGKDPVTLAPGETTSFVIDGLRGFYSIELWVKADQQTKVEAFIGRG